MSGYLPNKPLPSDLLSVSQGDIRNNFTVANAQFGINHYPFDNGTTNKGKHKFVHITNIASFAGLIPTPAANEGVLYTKQAAASDPTNQSQIFYTPDAGGNEYQLTRVSDAKFATFGTSTNYNTVNTGGWTFLPGPPGGLFYVYGQTTFTGGAGTVTFPVNFTAAPFFIGNAGNTSFIVGSTSTTNFTFTPNPPTAVGTIKWIVIGK